MKNHWEIKGICYWEKEISVEKDGNIWVNVGWHRPLCSNRGEYSIVKLLSISGYTYSNDFN